MVLDSLDRPVISYRDNTNGDLKVLHCTNTDCTGTQTPNAPDTDGSVGSNSSLVLDTAGNPVIAYSGSGLKVLHCTNPDCSGQQTPVLVDEDEAGVITSLALDAAGNPVIAYLNSFLGGYYKAHLLDCTNADCSGAQTPTFLGNAYPGDIELTLDGYGLPVISFTDPNPYPIVIRCGSADCSEIASHAGVDGWDDYLYLVGISMSFALDALDRPVFSYWSNYGNELKVVRCNSIDCAAPDSPVFVDETGNVGFYSSLELDADGLPIVSYYDQTNGNLKVVQCGNPYCSDGNRISVPDSVGEVGQYTSLALDSAGYPVVAYYDVTNEDLKVLTCANGYLACYNDDTSDDTDGDGCPDTQEQQAALGTEMSGGLRNGKNPWDYFNPTLDGVNRIDDISAVIDHYGHDNDGDPLYSTRYDRTELAGGNAWQFGPPNGSIRIPDILAAVYSYGHDCS
jgi:hypothetical protein